MFKLIRNIVIAFLVLVILSGSYFTVSQGTVALTKTFGKLNDTVYEPWFNLKRPFIDSVVKFNIQTTKDQATAAAASKDLQNVTTEVAVNYNVDRVRVKEIYTNLWNMNVVRDKVVTPSIQEVVKAVTSKYTAEELITKRNQISTDITEWLKVKLANYWLNVVDVNIINFQFSAWFDNAIEAKVRAEQDALAQKNLLEKVKYEAQQQIETAKAQAETIRISAEAISKQGWQDYVQLKWIEKWDWKLPTTSLGSTTPMINIK